VCALFRDNNVLELHYRSTCSSVQKILLNAIHTRELQISSHVALLE
jgi:hypothetical protein